MSVMARPLDEAAPATAPLLELRAGPERMTVRLGPSADIFPGAPHHPQSVITTDMETLEDLLEGGSGIQAFLDCRLNVRGNLALALQLDAAAGAPTKRRRHFRASRADADGIDTFYLEAGRGSPVVVLHGLGATNASVLPTLWHLAKNHRVIAPDLPGHGDTAKPLRPYHALFYARWLSNFLDSLGLDNVDLIGHSMGGRIALEAGFRMPERLDRLVLLTPSTAFMRHRQFAPLVKLLRAELAVVPMVVLRRHVLAMIRRLFADESAVPAAWLEAAADEFVRVFRTPRGRVAFFSAMRQIYLDEAYGPNGFWERLPNLRRPALFIWGRRDWLVPVQFARHVARRLPYAETRILSACGHVPQYEQPERTHGLIDSFLAR